MSIKDFPYIADISFPDSPGKIYAYACYDNDVSIGDFCVVKSAHHGFGIGKVEHIMPADPDIEYNNSREIVCRADFGPYKNRVLRRKKAKELKALMDARAKQLQDIFLYESLAKDDPEMRQLLDQFKELEL